MATCSVSPHPQAPMGGGQASALGRTLAGPPHNLSPWGKLQASQDSANLLWPGVRLAGAGELLPLRQAPEGLGGLWLPTWPGPFSSVSSLPDGICAGPLGPSLPRPL